MPHIQRRSMNSSDSFQLDEHLARLLAAYEQGIDGGDDKAPTIAPSRLLPPPPPLPGERRITPLAGGVANEASLGELLPDSENPNTPIPQPVPPAPSAATPRVGRFELRRQLGKGGCGIVFLAYDPKLEREVALKIPRPEMLMSQDARRRLVREALAAAEFDHPNLVPVYETGEIGPICFIATAFCPGQTLGEWLDKQAFPVSARQAARLVATVAEAVQHAHDRGVLHRDLKPANVILQATKDDPNEQEPPPGSCQLRGDHYIPRVVDFGLAKLVERGGPSETGTRQILGTPKYMSPEQALGRHDDVGPAADVYALGVILYEMLTGRPPYEGGSDVEVLRLAIEGHLTPPRHLRADTPRDLEAICLKAMDRSPGRRYRTAIDLADDLRRFLDDKPTLARPLNWVGRAGRWLRRNDQVVALATVTLVAVFFFALWVGSRYAARPNPGKEAERQAAEAERNRADQQREYAANVRRAFLAWRAGDAKAAAEALEAARKQASPADPVDFTLGYLARLVASERLYIVCPAGAVTALAVSPDGSRLASRHADGTLALWDPATGKQLASVRAAVLDGWLPPARDRTDWRLPLPGGFLANGPAGRVLVRTDRSYELPTGDAGEVRAAAVTRDGRTLFTAGDDGIIRSWDLATDLRDRGAVAVAGPVTAIAVDPEGRSFAVASGGSLVTRFGTADERPGPGGRAFAALRVLKDGTTLGVEFPLRGVAVVSRLVGDQRTEQTARLAMPDGAAAVSADLAADGTRVAVGDDRGRVAVWNLADGTALSLIDCGHRRAVGRVTLSTDGMSVAAPAEGNKVGVWVVGNPDPQLTVPADDQTVFRFLPGGRMATAGRGGAIRVWSLVSGQEETVLHGHVGRVSGLGISPDGRTMVSGGASGEVKLWDLRTGQELLGLRRHSGPVDVIEFAANGNLLVTGGAQVAVWEIRE